MPYCFVCNDTAEVECDACGGKGRTGGLLLGIGAKPCPMCSGTGKRPCTECDESRAFLLKPEEEPPLTQLGIEADLPHRPAITPQARPPAARDGSSNEGTAPALATLRRGHWTHS